MFSDIGVVAPAREVCVSGLSVDSRSVKPGDCFFALQGMRENGSSFVAQAVSNGAVAIAVNDDEQLSGLQLTANGLQVPIIVVPRLRENLGIIAAHFYGDPSRRLEVVAITGTNGKTTVAHICAQAMTALGRECGYIGTLGSGVLGRLIPFGLTTPDPIRLQADLACMLASGKETVVIEASSHALAQYRLAGTRVTTAVFTGLGHDHLDYHTSKRAYFEAKRSLFLHPGLRHAVLNAEAPASREIERVLHPDISLTTFALKNDLPRRAHEARVSLRGANYTPEQSVLDIETWRGAVTIRSPLVGDINAQNLLASLGVLLSLEVPLAAAAAALAQATPVCGRLEKHGGTDGLPLVFIDYAHSPDSLERVLRILRSFNPARLVCVFGCGGDRDRSKRPLMGQIAARYADEIIVTTDNPRSEDPTSIVREIVAGAADVSRFTAIQDRDQAIMAALSSAAPDDIVLIAGKGHETTQEINGTRLPQSDQATVQKWLAGRT